MNELGEKNELFGFKESTSDFLTPRNSSGSCRSRHWSQMSAKSPAQQTNYAMLPINGQTDGGATDF